VALTEPAAPAVPTDAALDSLRIQAGKPSRSAAGRSILENGRDMRCLSGSVRTIGEVNEHT